MSFIDGTGRLDLSRLSVGRGDASSKQEQLDPVCWTIEAVLLGAFHLYLGLSCTEWL